MASGSGRSEYNGLPIQVVTAEDDYRGLLSQNGAELSLECDEETPAERRHREVKQRIGESKLQIHDSDGRGPLTLHDPAQSREPKWRRVDTCRRP